MPLDLPLQHFVFGIGLVSGLTLIALGGGLRWAAGELRASLRAWFLAGVLFFAALLAWVAELGGSAPASLPAALLLCGLAEAWHGVRLLSQWRPRPRWPYLLALAIAAVGFGLRASGFDAFAFVVLGLACIPAALRSSRLRIAPKAQLPRLLCAMFLVMAAGALSHAAALVFSPTLASTSAWYALLGFWLLVAAPLALPLLFALALVERLEHRLVETSLSDELTGLPNRRALLLALDRALAGARRRQAPLAVLVLDIDHFSKFNARDGEEAGDAALRLIGRTLSDLVRGEDTFARIGGEEFAAVLPGCAVEKAIQVAERMRSAVASEPTARPGEWLSLSVGVVLSLAGEGTPEQLLDAPERHMQAAKAMGRDRVIAEIDSLASEQTAS